MAKPITLIPQSSSAKIAIAIFVLLVLSVVLLVFVLRGQLQHESTLQSTNNAKTANARTTTGPPSRLLTATTTTTTTLSPNIQSDSSEHNTFFPDDESPWLDFRLPRSIRPMHYDLRLFPDLVTDTFAGSVNVTVNVTLVTRHFVVHAYRMHVRECGVWDQVRQRGVRVERGFAFSPHEYFVVTVEEPVQAGQYVLCFEFTGSLNGSIIGFYKSRYKNSSNETR